MTTPADSLSLTNKVAIITGSGKEIGVGAAIATTFALAGARVVINYVSDTTGPQAAAVATRIENVTGKRCVIVIQADISAAGGAKKLVDETMAKFEVDHIDILVNNAAAGQVGPFMSETSEAITKVFDVNVVSAIRLIQTTVPHMPRGGRIINIGSVASKLGLHLTPIYGAAKAAMDQFTFTAAQELGREKGITINTVAPGPVMTDSFPAGYAPAEELKNFLISKTRAEERPGTVEDIADIAQFLAGEKSRWVTGQFISASGGITGN